MIQACAPSGEPELGSGETPLSGEQKFSPAPSPTPAPAPQPSPAPTPESSTATTTPSFNVTPGTPFTLTCSPTVLDDVRNKLREPSNVGIVVDMTVTCDDYIVSARIDEQVAGSGLFKIVNVVMDPKGSSSNRFSSANLPAFHFRSLVRTPIQVIDLGTPAPTNVPRIGTFILASVQNAVQSKAVLEGSSFEVVAVVTQQDGKKFEFPIYSLVMRIKPSG